MGQWGSSMSGFTRRVENKFMSSYQKDKKHLKNKNHYKFEPIINFVLETANLISSLYEGGHP